MSAISEPDLTPSTETLVQQCPCLRILVIGKSGSGKSALISTVFGVPSKDVSHRIPGVHDINQELRFDANGRVIVHDSQGFEVGDDGKVHVVLRFIEGRTRMPMLADRLHAIWVCAEIPFDGDRLFEAGVERILNNNEDNIPTIVVFTKLDILRLKIRKQLKQDGEVLNRAKVDERIEAEVGELCVQPLKALMAANRQAYQWAFTSTRKGFESSITNFIDLALDSTKLEDVWIRFAIAQRHDARASIEASIRIGRKRYWRGLFSNIFIGLTLRKLLDVLQRDIVNVWNMNDPEHHLQDPEFLSLLTILVEDLSDEATGHSYPLSRRAIEAAIDNPMAHATAIPVAIITSLAEWVPGTYKKTKNNLRCLVGFIIDLTLTMDTLCYLVLSRSQEPIRVLLVNKAIKMYKKRKEPVHASIRAWAEGWGLLDLLDPDAVINKIAELMERYRVKPEEWAMKDEAADENWITVHTLRAT